MESRNNPGPENLAHHNAVMGCLREAGFSFEMAVHAYSIQDSFIYGFALQERSLPAFESAEVGAEVADRVMRLVDREVLPYTAEMVDIHVRAGGYNLTAEFEFGLGLILDGLERLRAAECQYAMPPT
jgi:hypothetical protein